MRTGTKDRVLSQFMAAAQHAVPQQAFTLRVAGGLHLPSDLGHCVQHVEFGSRGYGGKPWIHHILDSLCKTVLQWWIYQQQALSQNNIWSIFFFFTWVRLEVFCCFGQEVKHWLVGHLNFLMGARQEWMTRRDIVCSWYLKLYSQVLIQLSKLGSWLNIKIYYKIRAKCEWR